MLSAQCSTPRPREHFAARTVRSDAGQLRDAVSDAGSLRDAGFDAAPREQSDAAAAAAAGDAGDAGGRDAGRADALEARVLAECGEPPVSREDFSREKLREASGRCAVYHYCAFGTTADALREATEAYASTPGASQLTAARAAYRAAMLRWSRAELFQFGPAASAAMSAGRDVYQGKGLRDRIYSWPAIARCRVEEQLVEAKPEPASALISARGLFAIEYALHFSGKGSDCPAGSVAAMRLAQLSDDAVRDRKARYAAAVGADIHTQTRSLIDAWEAFLPQFTRAEGYPNEQEALNVLGWALIYVEREMKDWKLGIPAGYTMTAPVSLAESPYAQLGTEALRENLRGFRALFQGCGADGAGLGFDDWLQNAGHAELAKDILEAYERAQEVLDALPPLTAADEKQLDVAYQTLRELTSLLKGDLFGAGSPLGLKLPASVEGDTD
ncbi:MAG TPA: imelysin family protein [Polyangiales bacterium]|nr:imelysin family protein [Polyangiales bacterium]